ESSAELLQFGNSLGSRLLLALHCPSNESYRGNEHADIGNTSDDHLAAAGCGRMVKCAARKLAELLCDLRSGTYSGLLSRPALAAHGGWTQEPKITESQIRGKQKCIGLPTRLDTCSFETTTD